MTNPYESPAARDPRPARDRQAPRDSTAFAPRPARYKWAVVGMLWFICFFNYADRQAVASVFELLKVEFKFDDEQLGLIGSAFMWVYALTAPLAGQVVDRFPRKVIILIGLYVWSAVTGFTALCTNVWQFVSVRATEGLGETFYFPASMSLLSDYHGKSTRSRAMSLHQTSVYAGIVGGGWLAGWMGQNWGWKWPFVILGSAGILLGVVLGLFIREPARNEAEQREHGIVADAADEPAAVAKPSFLGFLVELTGNPTAVCLAVAFVGANFVAVVFMIWTPSFLVREFGLSVAKAGFWATAFIQAGSVIGSIGGGLLADRWSTRLAGGRIATQSLGLLAAAPLVYVCGTTGDFDVLTVALFALGLSKGVYDSNIWASLYDVVPATHRGTAVGLMNMVGWAGGGLGSYALGWSVKHEYVTMGQGFASTGAIYVAAGVLMLFVALVFAPRDIRRLRGEAARA
jgi:MFS family permease